MFTKTFRTRSHEEFLALQTLLTQNAQAGLLTPEVLSAAIDKYYDDGDYIDRSIGTSWIIANPSLFMEVVPAEHRLDFLVDHLDRPHCSELLICYESVLNTLPTVSDRLSYIEVAFPRNGARNTSWVAAALKVGVGQGRIFLAINKWLEFAPDDDPKQNVVTRFDEFLSNGDHGSVGRAEHSYYAQSVDNPSSWTVPKDSPWGVCEKGQFWGLLVSCAYRAPHRVFQHWRKLSAKLEINEVCQLLEIASRNLQGLPGNIEALLKLPQSVREDLLRKHKPSDGETYTKLMVHTVLSASDFRKLNEEISENVTAVDPLVMYLTAKPILAEKDDDLSKWLRLLIQMRLQTAGYVIGKVREGSYEDRRRQETRRQLFVETLDGSRYINDRDYQRRYYPSVGDEVIFNPKQVIRRLTPKVFTVRFVPVDASKRR